MYVWSIGLQIYVHVTVHVMTMVITVGKAQVLLIQLMMNEFHLAASLLGLFSVTLSWVTGPLVCYF